MNNTAIIGYVPPPTYGHPLSFIKNLKNFKPTMPMMLYSDHDYDIKGMIKLPGSPELQQGGAPIHTGPIGFMPHHQRNKWATNNRIFFTGLRIAVRQGLEWMIYIESDCRVGPTRYKDTTWDAVMFKEFFSRREKEVIGGTMVCWSPCNSGQELMRRWSQLIADNNKRKNFPIPTYSAGGSAEKRDPCFLVNGALGIYNIGFLQDLFGMELEASTKLAVESTAWDFEIGKRMWTKYQMKVFDQIMHMNSIFSGFGEVQSTEAERMSLLQSGRVAAVHQIKSDWEGPNPETVPGQIEWQKRKENLEKNSSVEEVLRETAEMEPAPKTSYPKTRILIVSYKKDALWCAYALRSIRKYATGFMGVTVVVPTQDKPMFEEMCQMYGADLHPFNEESGHGHAHHQVMKCSADILCPDADYILHTDSDCLFTESFTPFDYIIDGKPVLWVERFSPDMPEAKGRMLWKEVTEKALGEAVEFETMLRHPAVHHKWIYLLTRNRIANANQREGKRPSFEEYVLSQNNWWTEKDGQPVPPGFGEFNALGNVALKYFSDQYVIQDFTGIDRPPGKLKQYWSRMPDLPIKEMEEIVS